MKKYTFIIILLGLISSCTTGPDLIISKMYFGLNSENSVISNDEFNSFVDSTITPVFPEGLTIYRTSGQWKNYKGAIIKEPAAVVEIIHSDNPETQKLINVIIETYKTRYLQESVLLIQQKAGIYFK